MQESVEILSNFLNLNLKKIEMDGSSGSALDFPNFDLMPHDYLDFAGKDISHDSKSSRINTVSNLKRALECELDILLHVLHLANTKPYASNAPRKLDFMDKLGLLSPRSFKKLNTIRNKIEHEYYVPEEKEIDTFYDLTFALISAIEGFLLNFSSHQSIDFSSNKNVIMSKSTYLTVEYDLELPSIIFGIESENINETLVFKADNYDEFTFAFSTYLLLIKSSSIYDNTYVLKKFNTLYQIYCEKVNKIQETI